MSILQKNRKKAVAYYRHAANNNQTNILQQQREQVHRYAQENNIEIIHEEIDERKCGCMTDRPGFGRLLNKWVLDKQAPQFDYVLVSDLSRLGRDLEEVTFFEYRCRERGKRVVCVASLSTNNISMNQLVTTIELAPRALQERDHNPMA
jgi:DNA invertase Pin-like site-specific DNA recombinase